MNWRELTSARRTHWPAVRGALPRQHVQNALNTTLLVVIAPAGYGKTTALAAGLPETGQPAAWLTLDADDADPQVLAAGLALAISHLPGGHVVGTLLDQGASPNRIASRTADVLHEQRAWLVIDEAHYLTSPLLASMLRELLDCGRGHVAMLSRVPLNLPELVPLEAAGIVTTLSAADLSFTPEELTAAGLDEDAIDEYFSCITDATYETLSAPTLAAVADTDVTAQLTEEDRAALLSAVHDCASAQAR